MSDRVPRRRRGEKAREINVPEYDEPLRLSAEQWSQVWCPQCINGLFHDDDFKEICECSRSAKEELARLEFIDVINEHCRGIVSSRTKLKEGEDAGELPNWTTKETRPGLKRKIQVHKIAIAALLSETRNCSSMYVRTPVLQDSYHEKAVGVTYGRKYELFCLLDAVAGEGSTENPFLQLLPLDDAGAPLQDPAGAGERERPTIHNY